ncbi:MAG: SMC-Scp complex subunit ScpB [Bacilli bacterium]|nr:SMC-Scp complex subunit ScpB [Bacilli bacterium]
MKAIVEGLLFLSGEDGLTLEDISKVIEKDIEEVKSVIKELYNDYNNDSRGLQIEFLGNHFKLTTKKEHKEYYKKLVIDDENSILSQSALETLAIIAYNAPLTRVDIDNIRGVNSSYVVRKLLLKGLIEEIGRSDAPGRPRLYNITPRFLDYFGLGSIDELPRLEERQEILDDEKYLFESKYKEDN